MLQRTAREKEEDGIPLKSSSSFVLLHLVFVLLFIRSGAHPPLSLRAIFSSFLFSSEILSPQRFPILVEFFCRPFKIGGAKICFRTRGKQTSNRETVRRTQFRMGPKPPKLKVKRGSNTENNPSRVIIIVARHDTKTPLFSLIPFFSCCKS